MAAAGKSEPDDEPISYEAILDAVGLDDALWCCRAEPQHAGIWRRFAVWCARHVQHLMTDQNSIAVLDVAERHANGMATDQELAVAWDGAKAAVKETDSTAYWCAALAAVHASYDDVSFKTCEVADCCQDAAWFEAFDAKLPPIYKHLCHTYADRAAEDAVDAAKAAQSAAFRQLVTTGTLPALTQRLEVAA